MPFTFNHLLYVLPCTSYTINQRDRAPPSRVTRIIFPVSRFSENSSWVSSKNEHAVSPVALTGLAPVAQYMYQCFKYYHLYPLLSSSSPFAAEPDSQASSDTRSNLDGQIHHYQLCAPQLNPEVNPYNVASAHSKLSTACLSMSTNMVPESTDTQRICTPGFSKESWAKPSSATSMITSCGRLYPVITAHVELKPSESEGNEQRVLSVYRV